MATQILVPSQRDSAKEAYGSIAGNRWIQLVCGIIAMIVISNYQYAFTLFTPGHETDVPRSALRENRSGVLRFHSV
jgi:hypothetical protein